MQLTISNNIIKEVLKKTTQLFADYETYAVGGFPRDLILGRETCDIDFATIATPEQIEQVLLNICSYDSVYRVGKRFGTLGCSANKLVKECAFPLEFTTYRTDTYDGQTRKPQIQFVNTLQDDLIRRDFTINALALNIKTLEVIDYFNGLDDLHQGILRTPMNAEKTFADDPLRMLRAIRFMAQLGFTIEQNTLQAITTCAAEIQRVSKERIMVELNKTLLSPYVSEALRVFVQCGLTQHIMPELLPMVDLAQNSEYHMKNVFEHTLSVVENTPPILHLRLAALLHDVGKPSTYSCNEGIIHFYTHEFVGSHMAKNILKRLKYSTLIQNQVFDLIRNHMRLIHTQSTKAVRRLINELSSTDITLNELLILGQADITSSKPNRIAEGQALVENIKAIQAQLIKEHEDVLILPFSGYEIMEMLNIKPGRAVGFIKHGLEELILNEELKANDKEGARKYIYKLYESYKNQGMI